MLKLKKTIKYCIIFILLVLLSTFTINIIVNISTSKKLYTSTQNIPSNKVGLLLGTTKYLYGGQINLYYQYRINAAVRLYKANKIKFILISGDNSRKEYDEPTTIKEDLIKQGIPENKIFLDYAGFRTLDSVVRCKKIFNQSSITVISQKFHNQRAIYIAKYHGIKAIGYNAKDVSIKYGFKTMVREKLARVKMILDLIINNQPKYLGKKIQIR